MIPTLITRIVLLLAAGSQLAGCTDPGCIRNSECEVPYSCISRRCVVSVEAGLAQPEAGPAQPEAGPAQPEDDAGIE